MGLKLSVVPPQAVGRDVFTRTTCSSSDSSISPTHAQRVFEEWKDYVLRGDFYSMASASLNEWLSSLAALVIEVLLSGTGAAKLLHWLWSGSHKCFPRLLLCFWFIMIVSIPAWTRCMCWIPSAAALVLPSLQACSNQCTEQPISTGERGLEWLPFPSTLSLVRPRCPVYPTCNLQPYFIPLAKAWVSGPLMSLLPQLLVCALIPHWDSSPALPLARHGFCHPKPCILLSPWAFGPPGTGTGWIPGGRSA